ncbi:hypothetical protein GGS24DRAFT_178599 [Hypoxylon argillaceum]|nr:hypothetical protein GGS24DRAFT_178599 [Hypoxylon argillaceum]KAI1152532.1 hypothetical protein F4825DRAFT_306234 [Nemania diffusa]
MTDQVSGSSLPQTRDLGRHQQREQAQEQEQEQEQQRAHLHFRNADSSHHHNHNHNHQHLHHLRSQRVGKVNERDTSDDNADNTSDVVVIVETISVLQITDVAGSTITQTLAHDSPTASVIIGSQSESAIPTSSEQTSPTYPLDTTSNSSTSDGGNGGAGLSPSSSSIDSIVASSGSSMPISFPTLSYAPITSTPLSATPVFPSLGGLSNSTLSSSAFSNSSISLHSFTAASDRNFSALGGATISHSKPTHASSVSTHSVSETSTSVSSSSVAYFTSTAEPSVTSINGGNGIGSSSDTGNGDGSASASASSSASGNTSAATIAGSVVGAISGLAIILLLAAVVFRWKKRQSSMKLLQASRNDRGYGATTTGGTGGPAGDGGMSERRRSIPFAIPAALANLSGHNRFSKSTVLSDGGERGFAKISGRKLPPVLQFGGDGYSDPRETMMSDQSIDYRASQSLFGEAALSRLAVGSPMLQETSIPVFHASPARTAVATSSPFSDPFSDDHVIESPTQSADPRATSRVSHDTPTRSHGSFSRFTENL